MHHDDIASELMDVCLSQSKGASAFADAISLRGEDSMLLYLLRADARVSAGDLSAGLGLTSGRVANIIRRLEEKGLVNRENDACDMRRVMVGLTESGKAAAEMRLEGCRQRLDSIVDVVGCDDTQVMLRALRRLDVHYSSI